MTVSRQLSSTWARSAVPGIERADGTAVKKSNSDPISEDHMADFKTRTYTKPDAGDECPGSV